MASDAELMLWKCTVCHIVMFDLEATWNNGNVIRSSRKTYAAIVSLAPEKREMTDDQTSD